MKKYLRALVEEFPHAAAESYHVFGWRGAYLAKCAYVFRHQPLAVSLPGFGKIDSWAEAINLVGNFSLGDLRSEEVENHLRASDRPCVVDVGVNVGVTCRWWLSLTDHAEVIGVDMFQEALDFATDRIGLIGAQERWRPICSGVGDSESVIELRFDNPLEGTSRIDSSTGDKSRQVRIQTLDQLLAENAPRKIGLLKLDIEGSAGRALAGASDTLARTDFVAVEAHSDEETSTSSEALIVAGFELFSFHGRTMWWRRRN